MGYRLVLIEDEPDISEPLRYSLGAEGYEVLVSSDGLIGLEVIRKTRPQIAIVDIMLPGIDGFEIVRRLRADTRCRPPTRSRAPGIAASAPVPAARR